MSYRTSVNGYQIFGNNEYYGEWIDFLKSEGIDVGGGLYDGYIDNLQGMFDVIDVITKKLIDDRHKLVVTGEQNWNGKTYNKELTDLSDSMWLNDETSILTFNIQTIENAYCFLPYQLFKAVEDIIEECEHNVPGSARLLEYRYYRLKDGKRIHVHAG